MTGLAKNNNLGKKFLMIGNAIRVTVKGVLSAIHYTLASISMTVKRV